MIDLSTQINAISAKYGENAFRCDACQAEIAQLWGITPATTPNKAFATYTVEHFGERYHTAEIRITEAPNGWWAMATLTNTPIQGASSTPNIYSPHAYESKDEARQAGIEQIIRDLDASRSRADSCQSQANIEHCNKLIKIMQDARQNQLSLFN